MGAPGFDNAPMVRAPLGPPKELTLIYPYYENPNFLKAQLEVWSGFSFDVLRYLRVIVVDDCSPRNPAAGVLLRARHPLSIRLFRIEVDVRWNWLAARNIAMHHAPSGWCLMTDMDHVVAEEAAHELTRGQHEPGVIYRLSRREHTGLAIHPHPNSMLLTREMFWKAGGYDEALSGHYGTDGDWRRRLAATAPVRTLTTELVRYEYVGDSSTVDYKRKQPEDAGKKRIIALRGKGWRPKTLSFPYHEVQL